MSCINTSIKYRSSPTNFAIKALIQFGADFLAFPHIFPFSEYIYIFFLQAPKSLDLFCPRCEGKIRKRTRNFAIDFPFFFGCQLGLSFWVFGFGVLTGVLAHILFFHMAIIQLCHNKAAKCLPSGDPKSLKNHRNFWLC